ncbi:Lcl C-terminal domain-containing protein [Sulfurimonas sp.]
MNSLIKLFLTSLVLPLYADTLLLSNNGGDYEYKTEYEIIQGSNQSDDDAKKYILRKAKYELSESAFSYICSKSISDMGILIEDKIKSFSNNQLNIQKTKYSKHNNTLRIEIIALVKKLENNPICNSRGVRPSSSALKWQNEAFDINYRNLDYNSAKQYCENLDLYGTNNWRLPKIEELESLKTTKNYKIDESGYIAGYINPKFLINMPRNQNNLLFWSETIVDDPRIECSYTVDFNKAGIDAYDDIYEKHFTMCIRD